MRRVLLISLTLVLVLVGWTAVGAVDEFYVIGAIKGKYAPVPKTGETVSQSQALGDDGALHKGVAWPTPRFTDHGNGTVTDNLTGLIWTQNANAFGTPQTWGDALTAANGLHSGSIPGLNDGSQLGDWRLPNLRELQSLIDYGFYSPAVPNTLGTGKWSEGSPFQGVQSSEYWSSTTCAYSPGYAWRVDFSGGRVPADGTGQTGFVWCVRGGK